MSPDERRERRGEYSRSPDRPRKDPRTSTERKRDYEDEGRSSGRDVDRERDRKSRHRRNEEDERERESHKRERSRDRTRHAEDRHRDRSRDKDRRRRQEDSRPDDRSRRRSPPPKRRRRSYSESRSPPPRRSRQALPSQEEQMRRENGDHDLARPDAAVEKQKPNYSASGLLAKEANTIAGSTTVLKYHEPPEARKPPAHEQWRMFIFKGDELLDTVHLFSRSCWLLGRDEKVTDLWLEHPSISKQHAVIQFRYIAKKNEYGDVLDTVKPYLIDLESANFTRLNKKKIAESRFVELRDGDVMTFGDSTREYVLMLPPPDKED